MTRAAVLTRCEAVLSPCGGFRYRLIREWEPTLPVLPFIMLNPSTADGEQDDPTIRRCRSFAEREGAGGVVVVNLYGFRAADPRCLRKAGYPTGPDNHDHIQDVARAAAQCGQPVVCAWGTNSKVQGAKAVLALLQGQGAAAVCLGRTAMGHPRHPLFVRSDRLLMPYP